MSESSAVKLCCGCFEKVEKQESIVHIDTDIDKDNREAFHQAYFDVHMFLHGIISEIFLNFSPYSKKAKRLSGSSLVNIITGQIFLKLFHGCLEKVKIN